jgi:hypothetical protein
MSTIDATLLRARVCTEAVIAIRVLHIGQGPIAYLSADYDVPMNEEQSLVRRTPIAQIHRRHS